MFENPESVGVSGFCVGVLRCEAEHRINMMRVYRRMAGGEPRLLWAHSDFTSSLFTVIHEDRTDRITIGRHLYSTKYSS